MAFRESCLLMCMCTHIHTHTPHYKRAASKPSLGNLHWHQWALLTHLRSLADLRDTFLSRSLPVLAMVAQPGPIGWLYDSSTLSLALPGHRCIHTHAQRKKKKEKRCWCYQASIWKIRNCWFCVYCWCCLRSSKQNTCSPVGASASLAAHNDVEDFVFMTVQRDVHLSPCFLHDIMGRIRLNSLPSPPTDVDSSGV